MHVKFNYSYQSCYIFCPKYLGAVLRTGSSKCLEWLLCDGFALQFVISLKSTRTGKDCMSNALENTSIKNWLIHWNRAEPSGVSSLRVSRKKPSTCRVKRSNQVLREKKIIFFLIQLLSKTQDCLTILKDWFSKQTIKTAPYDLEVHILLLACFLPLSMENNGTAWTAFS